VPPGVDRITVRFNYDRADHTTLDLGVLDPQRFRGWSGGNKALFTLASSDATPSYLPGPIVPGRWRLLMGIPNARPTAHSRYTARIYFDRGTHHAASDAVTPPPLRTGWGWYRGDLHMHDGHSDGSCASQTGQHVPCPLFRTVEAASDAGLDFIAVSDHNTVSQLSDLRELQPYFDKTLLIPATEITTFHGHIQAIGLDRFVDFRLGSPSVPSFAKLADGAVAAGAILSINHPGAPSGENCMGCGWTVPDTDYDRVQAIEAVNGRNADGPFSGLPFWYKRLNEGHHLTGIGGSDNHDPDRRDAPASPVGRPTTVVHARELSQAAILEGLRSGDVFIDAEGARNRLLEAEGTGAGKTVSMGGTLTLSPGEPLQLQLHAIGVADARWEIVRNGAPLPALAASVVSADARRDIRLAQADACGWVAANIRAADGRALLIGNPIYVRCTP
jgi:predicted metal-dependent phosphoesterase TrpH